MVAAAARRMSPTVTLPNVVSMNITSKYRRIMAPIVSSVDGFVKFIWSPLG